MPIDYDHLGDPPILYARWHGHINSADLLKYHDDVAVKRDLQTAVWELCDLTDATAIDVETEALKQIAKARMAGRSDPGFSVLKALLVPDAEFLSFARAYQAMISSVTQDHVHIVSEPAAALALLRRGETSIAEFLRAVRR